MKFRYRIDSRGWHIPQYLNSKDEWLDFKLDDLGDSSTLIRDIAFRLGKSSSWGKTVYYYTAKLGEKEEDMSLIFEDELKVTAFLGAAKVYFGKRIKEVEL